MMMMTKRIFLALILTAIAAVSGAVAQAQSTDADPSANQRASGGGILDVLDRIKQAQAQQLEGSWVVTVTPAVPPGVPQPPSFRAYSTFTRGGAYIGTDTRRLFNIQHGTWAHTGGNEFAFTFIEELVDAMGNFAGTLKLRVKLNITSANEYVGVANAEERTAAGVVTTIRCATIRGARITVEPLAPQCQSITPPQ